MVDWVSWMFVTTAPSGLRERTRRAVQAEIGATAMRLFLAHGFEATTMEQIANEAGISRRSLFRYFGTKEDIVLGYLVEAGIVVRDALEARPASEPPWEALRAAFESLILDPEYSPEEEPQALEDALTGLPHCEPATWRSSCGGRSF